MKVRVELLNAFSVKLKKIKATTTSDLKPEQAEELYEIIMEKIKEFKEENNVK